MKKLLSFIAVSAVLSGSVLVSQPASSPIARPDNVKHYNSITSAVNVQYAISETISSHPCDYYATGDDLTNFYAIIKNLIDTVKPSDESISQFCNSIKALGSVVDQHKADYSALKPALVQESITLFNAFGLNLVINSDNTCSLYQSTSNMLMVDSFPYLAPLPIALNYVAPYGVMGIPGYKDLRSYGQSVPMGDGTSITVDLSTVEAPTSINGYRIYQITPDAEHPNYSLNWFTVISAYGDLEFYDSNFNSINLAGEEAGNDILELGDLSRSLYVYVPEKATSLTFAIDTDDDEAGKGTYHSGFQITPMISNSWDYDDILKDGGTKTVYIDVDDAWTQDRILQEVTAVDLFGKTVPVIVKTSDYVVGQTGIFNIVLEAVDDYGQKATATIICNVRDYGKPVITLKNDVRYNYGTQLTEAMLFENFEFTDNMGASGLTKSFVYPTGFNIAEPLVFGSYSLTVKAQDAFGNIASLPFTLTVFDDVMPVISKREGEISDKIQIAYSAIDSGTIAQIISYFKAVDAVDGDCEIYLKSGKIPTGTAGDFTLIIGAKDRSGNEAIYTVNCSIVADLPPVFILSDSLVGTTSDNPLTLVDLQNLVRHAMLKDIPVAALSVNATGYLKTPTVKGSYPVSYAYTEENSNIEKTGSFVIKVTDVSELPDIQEPSDNWFVDAFKTVFSKDIDKATATDWVVVIGTFVLGIALIVLIVSLFKPKKKYDYSKYRRR